MLYYIQPLNADGSNNGGLVETSTLAIEDIEFQWNNLAADTWTFTLGGRAIDAAQLWPYGQLMAIQDANGNRVAFGRIEPWTRNGAPDAQNHTGRLVNPWWYLSKLIYQQRYSIIIGNYPVGGQINPNPTYQVITTPRVVMNILFNGTNGTGFYACTTGQQITDAINWAITQGAPLKLGTVDPGTQPFSDFKKGVMCSEVIQLMFHKEPDFIVDWDYTTVPFPTIHFRKTGKSLAPLTIDLTTNNIREQVQIRERPDWQRSYVQIAYDQKNQQNGQSYLSIYTDLYPNPIPAGVEAKFKGVDLYADLQGSNVTNTSQTTNLATVTLDITNPATWQRWLPELAAPNIASVLVYTTGGNPAADADHPAPVIVPRDEFDANGNPVALDPTCTFEIVDGEWADWIPNVTAQRVRCTAWILVTHTDGSARAIQHHAEPTLVSLNTNGVPTPITQTTSSIGAYAEQVPVGLAQAMWTSWQNLAIEGSFTNVEAILGTQKITRSNCLNFLTANPGANGRPDWRNVNAGVQRMSGSFLKGTTKVEFGAPLQVTGNELIDAIRATRFRVATVDLGYLFGGALGGAGSGNVRAGRKSHARAAHAGADHHQTLNISAATTPQNKIDPSIFADGTKGSLTLSPPSPDGTTPATGSAILDPAKLKGSDGNWHTVQFTEIVLCKSDGTQWTAIVPISDLYKAPGQT